MLVIDVIQGDKKIKGLIKLDLGYVRKPKPHITVQKLFKNELPKVVVMVYDGIDKKRGPDTMYTLAYNGFDKNDWKKREKKFETVKMPWEFIFKKFSPEPTINEFVTDTKINSGIFYIRTLEKDSKWPKISMKKVNTFLKELSDYKKQIYWEYGPSTE